MVLLFFRMVTLILVLLFLKIVTLEKTLKW